MSGTRAATTLGSALALTCLLAVTPAGAQQPAGGQGAGGQAGPAQEGPKTTELVFEREVFQYPSFERRNPFHPLVGANEGPRFESMRLQGIIYVENTPSESVALMGAIGGEQIRTRRMRTGETWGNVRLVEIRKTEILVQVEEFGLTEQRIMVLPTRRQGGS